MSETILADSVVIFGSIILAIMVSVAVIATFFGRCEKCHRKFTIRLVRISTGADFSHKGIEHFKDILVCLNPWCLHEAVVQRYHERLPKS